MKSRGLRNNNPGNIRIGGTSYQGEKIPSTDNEFRQFTSMAYGYRAMFITLNTYQKSYGIDTIAGMINRYAPSSENNTSGYIARVSHSSGISPDMHIDTQNKEHMVPIVSAMSEVENGVPAILSEVEAGWNLYKS